MPSLSRRIDRYRPFLDGSSADLSTPDFSGLEDAIRADLDTLPETTPTAELEVMYVLAAVASLALGAPDVARDYAQAAHDINPDRYEPCLLLSAAGSMAGHFESASYFLKLLSIGTPSTEEWVTTLVAPHLPDPVALFSSIDEAPYERQGEILLHQGKARAAEDAFRIHLAFFPDSAPSMIGAARALVLSGEMDSALDMLRAARVMLPTNTQISDLMASLLHQSGDFATAQALFGASLAQSPDAVRQAMVLNHSLNDPTLSDSVVFQQIDTLSDLLRTTSKTLTPRARPRPDLTQPLTLAYVLDPFRNEEEQEALADILRHHARPDHRIVGVGIGPLSALHNSLYKAAVDHWVDISGLADRTLARVIAAETPDALIATGDLRYPQMLSLFCSRIAPCQAALSRLPRPLALPHLDLFLPEYAENSLGVPLVLPAVSLPPVRQSSDGCLIALAGSLRDFTPALVATVASALHRLPQATLLIRNRDYNRDPARTTLLTRFGTFGLAHRVDVVDVASEAELCQNSDLIVLPPGETSPQMVITALAAGIPCLTAQPDAAHLERPARLLKALGLGDRCVGADGPGLSALIEGWATAPERRAAFAAEAASLLSNSPLLNAQTYATQIEQAVRGHLATLS